MDIFDAVREGSLEDVRRLYDGNINLVDNDLNLLTMAVTNDKLPKEKVKIRHFLLKEGIDINYTTKKNTRNAIHMYYFCVLRPNPLVALEITKTFVDAGILVNKQDKFGAIPLKYAITINKLPTDQNKDMYRYLLENESNYTLKDKFGKSCIDYAKEYSWRNDFFKIVEEYENEKKTSDYGGFVASKNVISGKPIQYTFREKSEITQLNGWDIYSAEDDDEYVNNSENFQILGATSLV